MSYTNAGHQSFYILKENGETIVSKDIHGTPLGIKEDSTYSSSTQEISIGDTIFLYTEGISSVRNPEGAVFGYKNIKGLLQGVSQENLSPIETCQRIEKNIKEFTQGAEQVDDYTMLAIKFLK